MTTRKDILDAALRCVNGDRDQQYGSPENSFSLIAKFWMNYLNGSGAVTEKADLYISSKDVAAMLSLLKIARIAGGKAKDDNWIDLAGYAACGGELDSQDTTVLNEGIKQHDYNAISVSEETIAHYTTAH